MVEQTIWQWVIDGLQQQDGVAVLIVVSSKGSSPGTAGAKMAVRTDGSSFGTVGGGRVEYELTGEALLALQRNDRNLRLFHRCHNEGTPDASGHLCGGMQQVLLWSCQRSEMALLRQLQQSETNSQPLLLTMTPHGVQLSECLQRQEERRFCEDDVGKWIYQEMIGLRKQAYLIGGGHVSLALSHVLTLLDFSVTVIDQRDSVRTMMENVFAERRKVDSYADIEREIGRGERMYVFVMTHSHATDQLVIERLAGKNFRYLGVLGSRRKIKIIRENLADKLGDREWDEIHAPIGLPINSRTPMEIAVSIAAELIQFDNG